MIGSPMNSTPSVPSGHHPDRYVIREWLAHTWGHGQAGWHVPCHHPRPNGDFACAGWLPAADLDGIADVLERQNRHGDVWLSATTQRKKDSGRSTADNALALAGLWADLDVAGPAHKRTGKRLALPPTIDAALDIVAKVVTPPTAVVHSGHGLQVWWLFQEPATLDAPGPNLADLERRLIAHLQGIAAELGPWDVDNVADLARVMRTPGTVNRKPGLPPAPVYVMQADWAVRYTPDELDAALPALAPREPKPAPKPAVRPADQWSEFDTPRPGDTFNRYVVAGTLLELDGWTFHHEHNGQEHWTRPGKDGREGHSATVYPDGKCHIYTSSAERLSEHDNLDPFGLFARLFHGGDFAQAARSWSQALAMARGQYGPDVLLAACTVTTIRHQGLEIGPEGVTVVAVPEPEPASDVQAADRHEADTADQQLESVTEALERRIRSRLYSVADLDKLPRPEWLVEGLFFQSTLGVIYGRPASGKSLYALDLACSVAAGIPFHGRPTKQCSVVYVAAEGSSGYQKRIAAWSAAHGHPDLSRLHILAYPVSMLDGYSAQILANIGTELGAGLVVLDTLARTMPGGDENGPKDMGRYVEAADRIKERTEATVLILHHEPRAGGNPRGHSSLDGAADTVVHITKASDMVTATMADPEGKQKDAKPADAQAFRISGDDRTDSVHLVATLAGPGYMLSQGARTALETLAAIDTGTGVPATRWFSASELSDATFWRALKDLKKLELTINLGTDHRTAYTLTDLGRQRLDSHPLT